MIIINSQLKQKINYSLPENSFLLINDPLGNIYLGYIKKIDNNKKLIMQI